MSIVAKAAKSKVTSKAGSSRNSTAYAAPLLPESMSLFLRRLLWRMMGLTIGLCGIFIVLSVFSYDPADPTFNNVTDAVPLNLLGVVGAHTADLLLQTLGLASYMFALPLFTWCWRIMRLRTLPWFWVNITLIPIALVLLSAAFAAPSPDPAWPINSGYGGFMGQWVYQQANTLSALMGITLPTWAFVVIFVALGAPTLGGTLGLSMLEWLMLRERIIAISRWVISTIGWALYNSWHWVAARMQGDEIEESFDDDGRPAVVRKRKKRTPQSIPAPVLSKRVLPKAKTEKGIRETKERQRTLDFGDGSDFKLPPLDLLNEAPKDNSAARLSNEALEANARMLETVLEDFGVQGEIINVRPGPVVTLYELEPAPGVKAARVIGLSDDVARSMSAISARIAVVPGRNVIGIELPNSKREMVSLREMISSAAFEKTRAKLPLMLGKDIGGEPVVADLSSMPHLLMAGTTGAGKSVGINVMILSLLYAMTPKQVRFIMVDPKQLELSIYEGIPHLLTPVVTEAKKAVVALKWAVREMETRYSNMSKLGVRNLESYNKRVEEAQASGEKLTRTIQTGFDPESGQPMYEDQEFNFESLPLIVVIIDEMADLMLVAGKDVEATVQRLAQMARAAGIHVIMATQRPSVDVITGTIKANFPTRISFRVTSKIDSRTILGGMGG